MQESYISGRLSDQMKYYSKQCKKLKKIYYVLSILIIFTNAAIPVVTLAVNSVGSVRYIIAILSAIATGFSSLLLLMHPKEKWIEYRNTYELLKKEKALFENHAGKYSSDLTSSSNEDFVATCEKNGRRAC
jgi:hypothetical protein